MSGFFRLPAPLGVDEAFVCRGAYAGNRDRIAAPALATQQTTSNSSVAAMPKSAAAPDPYGSYDIKLLRTLSIAEISALARYTGIHPDVLGPCRRAAAKFGWVLMFRAIKPAAMEYVGQYGMLPKPPELKVKCHPRLGCVAYSDDDKQAQLDNDVFSGKIDGAYAAQQGLCLDLDGASAGRFGISMPADTVLLIDRQGRAFYSDMDMFQVLNAANGLPVRLGSGGSDDREGPARAQLDASLNILASLGVEFALIQHGPERQWVQHAPKDERVVAFGPDGAVWTFELYDAVTAFEQHMLGWGYRRGSMLRNFRSAYRGG